LSSSGFSREWAISFAEIDRQLVACSSTKDVYDALSTTAVRFVPGAEEAGVTVSLRGRHRTFGATGQLVTDVDAIQYDLNSGPCVDAVSGPAVVSSADIGADERYREFGPRAVAETSVRSMLSMRLSQGDETSDGLNLYSTKPAAFDEQARAIAVALAGQGALAVVAARAREQAAQLETALANSRDIGIAMGVLMRANAITRDAAFQLLREASQRTHRKLADIARDVADTGTLDMVMPPNGP
jgi:GAF domain-containing protein